MQQSRLTCCVIGAGFLRCLKNLKLFEIYIAFFAFDINGYIFCIYRALAEINTVKGNNTEKSGKNRSRINGVQAKVLTLLSSMNDFCACV